MDIRYAAISGATDSVVTVVLSALVDFVRKQRPHKQAESLSRFAKVSFVSYSSLFILSLLQFFICYRSDLGLENFRDYKETA